MAGDGSQLDGSRLILPRLHAAQRRIGREAKRFNTIDCGRRFGKTKFGLVRAAVVPGGLLKGHPVGWFAPTYKYLADVWREAVDMLRPLIVAKDKSEKRIHLSTGGVFDFWTLDDPDAGRSRKYGHVIIDEAAKVRDLQTAWEQSIRPTLSDLRGSADILSTPKGRNYFAQLFDKGDPANGGNDQWASFQMPTAANPHIDPREIEDARADLPELVFAQEYLAQFVDFGGTAVKREWLKYGNPFSRWRRSQLRIAMGVDLAISEKEKAAYTAFVIVAIDPEGNIWVLFAERGRLTFHKTQERIKELASNFRTGDGVLAIPQVTVIESVQYQAAVVQELLRTTSLNVVGRPAEKDKLTRFQPLQKRYETGLVFHGDDLPAVFEGELLAFPEGETKDMVDALVYAWLGASEYDLDQTAAGAGVRIATERARAAEHVESDDNFGTVSVELTDGG